MYSRQQRNFRIRSGAYRQLHSVPAAWITVSVERNNHDEKEDGQ